MTFLRPFTAVSALALSASAALAGPGAMTFEEARHLLGRTGFGAAPHEIRALEGQPASEAIGTLLGAVTGQPSSPMPDWTTAWPYPSEEIWTLTQREAELFETNRWLDIHGLSSWWIAEMVATPSPLTERLTLFWHDHFATSFDGAENVHWIAGQHAFLRQNAAGNFRDLAAGILRDPAMLAYLSNLDNSAAAPNEDLGREFLELFTLGEGRGYSQDDVRAAAAILTGHTVAEFGAPTYRFVPELHDDGPKTLFGQTGRFDVDDLVAMTLGHPEFGPYVVEKLWLEFVSDQPDPAEIDRLVALWKANDLEMKPLLEALFTSDAFWSEANRGRLIKGPVDLLVGTSRSVGLAHADASVLNWAAGELGQTLFFPPNVGGWPQGAGWITDATASGRSMMLTWALDSGLEDDRPDPAMAMDFGNLPDPVAAGADDLRVGKVFALFSEKSDEEEGGLFVLYDVGFDGHDWRSISFWLAHEPEDEFTGLFLSTADCAPACFDGWPVEEDDQLVNVIYTPWEGLLDEEPELRQADHGLMQALSTHLPALIASTEGQRGWEAEDGEQFSTAAALTQVAERLAANSADALGASEADLVWGFSRPDALGLGAADPSMFKSEDDLEDYYEQVEIASARPAIPQVVHASAGDWLEALSGPGSDAERAARALLAVPYDAGDIGGDAEDILQSLLLAPEFQLK